MKRKILLLITIFAMTMSFIASASAAAPSTVKFNYRSLSGVNAQNGAATYYKSVTSGGATIVSYCLQRSLKIPTSGSTVSYKSAITDPGIIYIYSNGFGGTWNTTLLGSGLTNDQRYYATQMALWIYQGQLSTSNLNTSDAAVIAAIKLSNAAKSAKSSTPSISISSSSTAMTFDGTYYKSKVMTVTGTSYANYTVTLVNAGSYAQIVTTSGSVYSSGTALPAGTQFYVRIPDSKVTYDMTMTVKVSASAKVTNVYKYTNGDSTYQDVGIMMASTTTVTDSTSIKLTKEVQSGKINIIKRDADTKLPLAGATLVLKDSSGKTVDQWVSTTSARTINNLKPGTYYLSETKAPNGYTLSTKTIAITLTAGDSKSVIFDNTPVPVPQKAKLSIIKRDAVTMQPLAGATLVLKDSSGRTVDQWVSTTSARTITGLNAGTYYLSETKAPNGYTLSTRSIAITLTAGDSKTVIFDNTPVPVPQKANLSIIKRDAVTMQPLAGATLVLKDSSGRTVDQWVSTTSARTITGLNAGTYYLSELTAPNGYTLSTRSIAVTLTAGETKTVIFDNTPKETPKYNVNIVKVDSSTGKNLEGATLVLKDSNGNTIDQWVSTKTAHTIKDLAPGVYTVIEIKAPTGYILNSTPVKFTVVEGGENNKTITIYNIKEDTKTYSVKISKQDITTKKELPGATLTLKDANGNVVETWVSTKTAHYVTGLTPGKYTLIETKSPKGYGLSDEVIEFTVNADGKVDKPIIMYNSPIPVTADRNLVIIFIGFAATIALGGFGMYKLSKQD